jgi:hypothetical protein
VTEQRGVEYEPVAPPQSPGSFQKYKGTSSVQWSINATLICRTTAEATDNLRILNQLRAWTMPYFGENTRVEYPTKLGAPPPVLEFSGFRQQMIGPVPVVITSLNWSFPQDVDYIPAQDIDYGTGEVGSTLVPFPTVMKVSVQVVESFSTDQLNGFDLDMLKNGRMDLAWMSLPTQGINYSQGTPVNAGGAQPAEAAQTTAPNAAKTPARTSTATPKTTTNLRNAKRGNDQVLAQARGGTPTGTAVNELKEVHFSINGRPPQVNEFKEVHFSINGRPQVKKYG